MKKDPRIEYYKIAYIFAIICMILSIFVFIIPILWTLPMMLAVKKRKEFVEANPGSDEKSSPILLGICYFLFVPAFIFGLVVGIFLILASSNSSNSNNNNNNDSAIEE